MKQLFEMDLHDYEEGNAVVRRRSARAILVREDGRIALVYGEKEHYYKFPGGGIHDDEEKKAALIREVKEEVGLTVIPETIQEFGSVMRRQKSNVNEHTIFEQENFYYTCQTRKEVGEQNLDEYEAEAGFKLRYVTLGEAIQTNLDYTSDDYFDYIMIQREAKVLQCVRNTVN